MNYTAAILIVKENVRVIKAKYEKEEFSKEVLFKTTDPLIKVGDIIVVPSKTRHNFTTNKVVDVDVVIDTDLPQELTWVAARVDLEDYNTILVQEEEIIKKVKSAEMRQKREALLNNLEKDRAAIEALPLITAN